MRLKCNRKGSDICVTILRCKLRGGDSVPAAQWAAASLGCASTRLTAAAKSALDQKPPYVGISFGVRASGYNFFCASRSACCSCDGFAGAACHNRAKTVSARQGDVRWGRDTSTTLCCSGHAVVCLLPSGPSLSGACSSDSAHEKSSKVMRISDRIPRGCHPLHSSFCVFRPPAQQHGLDQGEGEWCL